MFIFEPKKSETVYLKSQIVEIYFSIVFSTFWVSNIFVSAKVLIAKFFEEAEDVPIYFWFAPWFRAKLFRESSSMGRAWQIRDSSRASTREIHGESKKTYSKP